MKKRIVYPLVIIATLVVVYFLGPKIKCIELDTILPVISVGIDSISQYVEQQEAQYPVKPDNESIILWGDSVARPTSYVLLYLHGFSASRNEGYPVTHDFVKEFKVNAYLPRLAEHGLMLDEPLLNMTPTALYNSAKQSLVIAHKLGQKVVIMAISTGCTLALMLAADYPKLVDGLILYSPNIKIKDIFSPLLSGPWGLQLTRMAHGSKYYISGDLPDSEDCKYWYCRYRVEAQVYLQQLLDMRMNEKEFAKVHQALFLGYYYKDEKQQDQTIDVKAALKMFDELGSPKDQKVKMAFPRAGAHVIASEITSKSVDEVKKQTFKFARHVLKMQ